MTDSGDGAKVTTLCRPPLSSDCRVVDRFDEFEVPAGWQTASKSHASASTSSTDPYPSG